MIGPSLADLKKGYEDAVAYVHYLDEHGLLARQEDVSQFWSDILGERRSYPSFNEMLVMRRGFTYPMAERRRVEDVEAEREYAHAAYGVVSASLSTSYLRELQESPLGCPATFDFDGRPLSASAIVNALTAWRILECCREAGLEGRPLRVLEIGAGYGQVATQLLERLDIGSYVVCDLAENLFLSAFYLQGNYGDRSVAFLGEGADGADAQLVFLVPSLLESMSGPFDLVVNSYSFQEMTRRSVEEYFAFVERTLAPDGLFFSLNAHGKSEIARASEYPVSRFSLHGMRPVRRFPFQLFATNPYELVMRPRVEPATGEDRRLLGTQLDALASVLQLGLHDEVLELCRRFAADALDEAEASWLEGVHSLLEAGDYDRKRDSVERMRRAGVADAVTDYLAGTVEFAAGRPEAEVLLARALPGLARSHASVRARLLLAALAFEADADDRGERLVGDAIQAAPHLAAELREWARRRDSLASRTADELRLRLPRPPAAPASVFGKIRRRLRMPAGARP